MAGTTRLQVLLVEDNEHDMQLIKRCFRRMTRTRAELDWGHSLGRAIALASERKHDVALVDLDIGDSWGLATLEKIRAAAPHLPVIVLTGATAADDLALETLRSGAQDYLSKDDLSPQVLERTIEYAVERHRLMGMVTRSERMASIGQLSAGMAHELNSPLAQIRAELDELRDGLRSGADVGLLEQTVDRALNRVEHIRTTVEALYSFSSAQRGKRELFQPEQAVLLARRLAENSLKHVAHLEERIDIQLPAVHGDQGRFIQAVLDLLNHAADVARHRRGRLGRVWLHAYAQGGDAVVVVEDDGPPVPASQRERLFEPFGASRGGAAQSRGLGLTAAREIVRELGGTIEVHASRHGGARFEVRIPGSRRSSAAHAVEAPAGPRSEGRARVLWIDDDVHLLRAFQRRLRRDHDVEVCESADEALRRIERGERWDVICCDLMMPQMSGREFEEILAARYPDLAIRMIFVTGGVFTEEERRFLEQTRQPRLLKPFDWDALLDAVDDVRSRAEVPA